MTQDITEPKIPSKNAEYSREPPVTTQTRFMLRLSDFAKFSSSSPSLHRCCSRLPWLPWQFSGSWDVRSL
jgi:hypothetical protein